MILRYHECSAKILLIFCLSVRQSLTLVKNDLKIYRMSPQSHGKALSQKHHSDPFQPAYISTIEVCQDGKSIFPPLMNYPPNHSVVTHPSLHMRDGRDAQVILEAVRLNILPLIKRRLLASERDEIQSGHIYVWEEAQDDGGLLRWTDGRRWSQSRMRGDFLFYEEKIETTQEEREAKAARRAHKASDPNAIIQPPMRRKDRPSKPNGLIKQTYSVSVHLPGMAPNKKWHAVAYFAPEARLPVIENYANLRNINVPPGIFSGNKILLGGLRTDFSDDDEAPEAPYPHYALPPPSYSHATTSLSQSPQHLSPQTPTIPRTTLQLPPISFLREHLNPPPQPRSPFSGYSPLSPEDRRALDQIKNHFIKM